MWGCWKSKETAAVSPTRPAPPAATVATTPDGPPGVKQTGAVQPGVGSQQQVQVQVLVVESSAGSIHIGPESALEPGSGALDGAANAESGAPDAAGGDEEDISQQHPTKSTESGGSGGEGGHGLEGLLKKYTKTELEALQAAAAADKVLAEERTSKWNTYYSLLLKGGVVLEAMGDMVPFPGASGVTKLLCKLINNVENAMNNKDNLTALKDRCLGLLEVVVLNQDVLVAEGNPERLMNTFADILMEVVAYAGQYGSYNFLLRTIHAKTHADKYNDLVTRLQALVQDVQLLLTAIAAMKLEAVQAQVLLVLKKLTELPPYKDHNAQARDMVLANPDGLKGILADEAEMTKLIEALDVGHQVNIAVTQAVLEEMTTKRGAHSNIKHLDMRVFWYTRLGSTLSVKWHLFWSAFPKGIDGCLVLPPHQVSLLASLLQDSEAHQAFEQRVQSMEPKKVSVFDIDRAFPATECLAACVARLVGASDIANTRQGAFARMGTAIVNGAGVTPANDASRFCLASPDPLFVGREVEADSIVKQLQLGCTVAIVAEAGMGKSSLALDVGARMWAAGSIAAGARFVDLRDSRNQAAVLDAFANTVGTATGGKNTRAEVLAALAGMTSTMGTAQPLLLLIDNAENALRSLEMKRALLTLLCMINDKAPHVRLLITSRTAFELPADRKAVSTHTLLGLTDGSAERLVLTMMDRRGGQDAAERKRLTGAQLAMIADRCRRVPLLLRLVAVSLVTGIASIEEIGSLALSAMPSECESAAVAALLKILPKAHQQELQWLSNFAGGFDDADAAAVINDDLAHVKLQVLYNHDLVMYADAERKWRLHAAVREASTGLHLDTAASQSAAWRYVRQVLQLLEDWGKLYDTTSPLVALQSARARLPDINAALAYLAAAKDMSVYQVANSIVSLTEAETLCVRGLSLWRNPDLEAAWQRLLAMLEATLQSSPGRREQLAGYLKAALSGLASTLSAAGTMAGLQAAEPLYDRVLELRTKECSTDNTDVETLNCLNSLANCISKQGRHVEAEQKYRKVVEGREAAPELGPEHRDTLCSYNNLAICISAQGREAEAEQWYKLALEVRERTLPPLHLDTLTSLSSLAICIGKQDREAEAEELHRRVLAVREAVLGPEHLDTLSSLHNVADCTMRQGRYGEAELLLQKALAGCKDVPGLLHLYVLISLGDCLDRQGKHNKAEPLLRQAVDGLTRELGPQHGWTLQVAGNLQRCLDSARCNEGASVAED